MSMLNLDEPGMILYLPSHESMHGTRRVLSDIFCILKKSLYDVPREDPDFFQNEFYSIHGVYPHHMYIVLVDEHLVVDCLSWMLIVERFGLRARVEAATGRRLESVLRVSLADEDGGDQHLKNRRFNHRSSVFADLLPKIRLGLNEANE
jgi:hypothetical protein